MKKMCQLYWVPEWHCSLNDDAASEALNEPTTTKQIMGDVM